MSSYSIRKELHVQASKEIIFDALTNSKEIVKYYPLSEVVSDWKVGGEVLYKGEVDGAEFTDFGIIEKLARPNEYRYRYWSDNHGTERILKNYLSIHYKLIDEESGTKLVLEQDNLRSKELFELMNDIVWDSLLEGLRIHVETGT
ncbi:MAG: activator of HSP90 ATPase [SAR86 cluster bacterium]|uniref:Activator of HSP90 ATPase n=1 Tax=SAR86 cluster bacterium TaxID=2030880 RepID=A0A2A4XBD7_9GAMM|nr:MAG: activator of HSP90 ATPase [SAR86 cluster bacterium]